MVREDDTDGIRAHLVAGLAGLAALALGGGVWAATTPLAGAVIAQGRVVVESDVKKIQHQTGGRVAEICVRDGDRVAAGDLLLRLDPIVTRANLQVVVKQLDAALAQEARLLAERDGATTVDVSPLEASDIEFAAAMQGERTLFASRRAARAGQKAQLAEQLTQMHQQIAGHGAQYEATESQRATIATELQGVDALYAKKLIAFQRLTTLQREAARLAGESGRLTAAIAEVRGKVAETELKILQIDADLQTDVMKDLRAVQEKAAELVEHKAAAEDVLDHVEIRSPQAGLVHALDVHTVGGVVTPGQTILEIVPLSDALVVEAKVAPQDVNDVRLAQGATVRFPAFDVRTTPEIEGRVMRVAAELTKETDAPQSYYIDRIAFAAADLAPLGGIALVPGMPAEVHIKTGERTVLTYLLKPLRDQLAKAFREK